VELRLTDPALDFWVDVRLRSWGDRWLAVADIAGESEVGLGRSAREALGNALTPLGELAARAFLADPTLSNIESAETEKADKRHGDD